MGSIPRSTVESTVMTAATRLDRIASLSDPAIPLPLGEESAEYLIFAHGQAVADVRRRLNQLHAGTPGWLFEYWAREVSILATRWGRGDPLAKAPFRAIARDCLQQQHPRSA